MVYIKPVLASAVAFTLVSSVAALPAHRNVARDDAAPASDNSNPPPDSYPSKRDGPMVVQAKSLQATKRGYVGGGAGGAKKLKQAPLMKAAKLFRSKRDVVEARDEHIHEHIHEDEHHHHEHDDHHHHHDDDYDHHHSEHYNYHHGLTDHDDRHHHHERDLVNIAALNNNSPSNNKVKKINKIHKSSKKIGKINKCKGSHFHCNQHKRDEASTGNDADGEDNTMMEDGMDNTRLVRRRKNSNGHRYKNTGNHKSNNNNNGWKNKQAGGDKTIKANTEISTGGFKRTGVLPGKMNPGLSARHHDHHDHHDDHEWEHEHEHVHYHDHEDEHVHEHIHSHEHKRNLSARRHEHDHEDEHVHMHIHEDEHYDHHHHDHYEHHHNDKRRHRDHDDDAWLDEMTYHREWRDGHAHIHLHEHEHEHDHDHDHDHDHYHGHNHHHDKRQATQNGIPGFVEVANTLAGTTLAKSVAGLVFSKGPDPNASGFLLGTSDTQSTQFYLVPNQDSSSIETSQSVNATMDTPEDNAKTYQLRIPVLDSKTFESNDYCATFDVLPPSPMTMAPCKYKEGFSQIFKYNATTGELTPVYPPTDSNPKPMNAAVRYSEPQVMAAKFPVTDNQVPAAAQADLSAATGTPSSSAGSSTWSTDSAMSTADGSASSSSSDASATDSSSSSAAAPQSSSSATPSDGTAPADAPKVSLFFIPASTYASGKESSSSTSEQSSTSSSSTPTTSDSPLFSALPAQAKIVTPSDGNEDWSNISDDSGVVTTTVVVTSTMDAESAQATPAASSDWTSSDASSGESQAWTNTDGPAQ